jgi:threonine dehydrogenase-like Zn-dependent dehydrogenase
MNALTYFGPGKVRVVEKPDPRIEHPNDIILRVTRTAICGSDLHLLAGLVPDTRVGSVFGHEFAGVVEEVGPGVRSLVSGDRVVVPFNISCGVCFFCEKGFYACCETANPESDIAGGAFGYSHTTGGYDGGQADYVRVPFADVGPMKIPTDMDEEDVLFLSDILPTGYMAAEMGDIQEGDTVIVFGCGPVGLFAQKCAWLMGAGRVIAVDRVPYRLEFAKKYNNVETVNFDEVDDILAVLKKMTDGRGADVCIEAVGCEASGSAIQKASGMAMVQAGSPTALFWSVHAARRGGRVSIVGVYGPPANFFPVGVAMNKNLTLRLGQCNVRRYMPHLLELIREGTIDAKGIISHRLPLEAAPDAYEIFRKKQDDCIKCVLIPSHAQA